MTNTQQGSPNLSLKNPDVFTALHLLKPRLKALRAQAPKRDMDFTKPAEVEINKFYWKGKEVDRIMVVLRATGCDYFIGGGCAMCGHYDGTAMSLGQKVSTEQYKKQWDFTLKNYDLNRFPIVCLYNLGDFLSTNEIPLEAKLYMFETLNDVKGVEKVIIEARGGSVNAQALKPIRDAWDGVIEVGVGLESSNDKIRTLCHRKGLALTTYERAIQTLNNNGFESLSYVNMKPPFVTEREAITDAVSTIRYAFGAGSKAVSLEPTSIQENTLTEELMRFGLYRVPWLWSVREVMREVSPHLSLGDKHDLRIGGYFPEKVLLGSGSGGAFPFPTVCSTNCPSCDDRLIKSIARFNETYNPAVIVDQPACDVCYSTWERSMKVSDSRPIEIRVVDALGKLGEPLKQ